ncbi:MAG TPA: hypothetical protein VL418_15940, partial [Devosiaceae bacterium]|nr:hypothetical protein [Devosiaceae bacterium]
MSSSATTSALQAVNWPQVVRPGPETRALERFHRDASWTGTIKAAGGVPEMSASGSGKFRWSDDGLWIIGAFQQDQFHGGEKVASWNAHYLAGWDFARKAYIAFAVDSNGRSVDFTGEIIGDSFIITSDILPSGAGEARLRMTWDLSDPAIPHWKNETAVSGGPWMLI